MATDVLLLAQAVRGVASSDVRMTFNGRPDQRGLRRVDRDAVLLKSESPRPIPADLAVRGELQMLAQDPDERLRTWVTS